MQSEQQRQQLTQRIAQVRSEAGSRILAEMYQNPFWKARYGERGEKQSNKDVAYNFNYLEAAIRMDTTTALEEYYRWLRGALAYRGMCTRHLVETLDCTARHLSQLLPEDWPAIEPYHRAGYQGLSYRNPTAQALHAHSGKIAEATTRRMFDPQSTGQPQAQERAYQACLRDNLYHLSYLADAFEMEKLEIFTDYIEWVAGFVAPFGVSRESLLQDLRVLQEQISTTLPKEHAVPLTQLLEVTLSGKK